MHAYAHCPFFTTAEIWEEASAHQYRGGSRCGTYRVSPKHVYKLPIMINSNGMG